MTHRRAPLPTRRLPRPVRVGLIGLGTIATSLVELIGRDRATSLAVVGALVRDLSATRAVDIPLFDRWDALLACEPDIVAEAAGHEALKRYGVAALEASRPLIFLSVGALADRETEDALRAAAVQGATWARAASGGVGGLDMISSAAQGGLESVVHRMIKPPRALGADVEKRTTLYRGSAREAALRYPQNANVTAAVALAGIGLDHSLVEIIADPDAATNSQEIEVVGTFGRLRIYIENRPSATNPRTSAVVGMSLKEALERTTRPLQLG